MSDRLTATRRRALKAVGAASVAGGIGVRTAGLGSASRNDQSAVATEGVFDAVEMDGEFVYLTLTEPGRVNEVRLDGPDGNELGRTEPQLGETAVRFSVNNIGSDRFSDTYGAGTYVAVATGSNGTDTGETGRAELDLHPSASVVGFECRRGGVPTVVVENDGTGPGYVEKATVRGGVPGGSPSTFDRDARTVAPGNRVFLPIISGNPVRVESEDAVAEYAGGTETATFSVTVNGSPVTSELDLTYEGGPIELDDGSYTFERVVGGALA